MKSICLAVACLIVTSVAAADTITVCLDGSCDYTDIQAAINAASNGDVIEIAAGVYEPPATLDTLGKAITLSGHVDSKSGELLTILDGRAAIRILECINGESPTTVLQGLVFQSGLGGGPENYSYGGAAYLENAGPTFENCTFTDNSAWRDSAVDCRNNSHPYAEPVFNNCRFVANQQGAVGLQSFVTVHFNNCVFEENIGTSVTAHEGSVAEMNACVFRNNEGGAFGSSSIAWANMYDCLIDGNQGGVSMTEGFGGEFVGCTFRENSGYSVMSLSSQRSIIGGSGFQTRITDCEFIANGDDASSAALRMLFTDCDVRVVGCSFIDNVGLAIESRFTSDSVETAEDHPYISGCTITGNQGGGIWIRRSNAIVTGCDISCNTSGLTGAGIQATGCIEGGPTISTTVISNNNSSSSSHLSAGVYFNSNTDNPYFAENTVCSNAAAQVSGDYDDGGGNQITDVCGGKYVTPGMDLNEVIQNALACSVLQLSEGTWTLDSAIDLEGKGVTIRGSVDENGDPTSILDGNDTTRVLQLISGEDAVEFENLVIQNGSALQGAGMYISGTASTPVIATFQNCIIRDNPAVMVGGGAFVTTNCTIDFIDCRFSGNSATVGGGVASGGGVSFAGTTLCGNPGGNIHGDYIDNGGNCIAISCGDSNGDGVPDACQDLPGFDPCPSGTLELTQNYDLVVDQGGIACQSGGISTENLYARSYDLAIGETAGLTVELTCVQYGVENAGSEVPSTVSVYLDTNGGAPEAPGMDLELLGQRETIAVAVFEGMQRANFDPPICIPADSTIVVTAFFEASPDGFLAFASNDLGASHPTYVLSKSCELNTFVDLADIGFSGYDWVQILVGNTDCVPQDCPTDFNGDGVVDGGDLGSMLAAWGACSGCPEDLTGDGLVDGGDLGLLLAAFGPCE